MKILQVIPYFAPASLYGGPVRLCYELTRHLAALGHSVTVFTTDSLDRHHRVSGPELPELAAAGVEVFRFRTISSWLAFRHHLFLTPGLIGAARGRLREFDIVHIHEYRTMQAAVVAHYAHQFGVPYVLQGHGSMPRRVQKIWLKSVFDNLIGHRILEHASRLIGLTPKERQQYQDFGIDDSRIAIIPYGPTLSDLTPPSGSFRSAYSIGPDEKVILFMGRLSRIKGLDVLIDAYREIAPRRPETRLVIAGPDDDYLTILQRKIAEARLEKRVLLTGDLQGEAKTAALAESDIFVLPSYDEGLSMAALEACNMGLPVVLSEGARIPGIEDYRAGLVFETGNSRALVEALTGLLDDAALRREYGQNARKMIAEQYNPDTQVRRMVELYQQCIDESEDKSDVRP